MHSRYSIGWAQYVIYFISEDFSAALRLVVDVFNFTAARSIDNFLLSLLPPRTQYNQSSQGSQCNQAIMLITDGTSETHSEVCVCDRFGSISHFRPIRNTFSLSLSLPFACHFQIIKHYNWPHRPVRIFTYLIGGGSGSRESMHTIACSNKGFYVQINTPEDAKKRVVEYALVMARPMVLYQADHPIHWSPVFVGGRSGNMASMMDNQRRLVTTVSTPVFDRRNHSVRVANLLGVVGSDVPIEEIIKMIPQHKVSSHRVHSPEIWWTKWKMFEFCLSVSLSLPQLGVNGYSFVVDNNGKVLYHPDFRPTVRLALVYWVSDR